MSSLGTYNVDPATISRLAAASLSSTARSPSPSEALGARISSPFPVYREIE
jgi:hypothetical protein